MSVHRLVDKIYEEDGLIPALLIFTDKADKMIVTSIVQRDDWVKLLASAAVFTEVGRPGSEHEVDAIVKAVKTAVSQEAS